MQYRSTSSKGAARGTSASICIQSEGLVDYFLARCIHGYSTNLATRTRNKHRLAIMAYVSESLMAALDRDFDPKNIDLGDPHWRVASQGWFSDEEEAMSALPETKKFKGVAGGQCFYVSMKKSWATSL